LPNYDLFGPDSRQQEVLRILSGVPGTQMLVGTLTSLWTTCVAPCRQGFLGDPNKARTAQLFRDNSGVSPVRDHNTAFSARVDHSFSTSDQLFGRFNFTKQFGRNTAVGALLGFSRGNETTFKDWNFALAENHIFSPNAFNESRIKFSYTDSFFLP